MLRKRCRGKAIQNVGTGGTREVAILLGWSVWAPLEGDLEERCKGHEESSLRMSGGSSFQAGRTSRQVLQGRSISVCCVQSEKANMAGAEIN